MTLIIQVQISTMAGKISPQRGKYTICKCNMDIENDGAGKEFSRCACILDI